MVASSGIGTARAQEKAQEKPRVHPDLPSRVPEQARSQTTLDKEMKLQAADEAELLALETKMRADMKIIEHRMTTRRSRISWLQDHPQIDVLFQELMADGVFKLD